MKKIIAKRLVTTLSMFCVVSLILVVGNPAESFAKAEDVYYTCPMSEHSDVALDKPGKCPKCGMELVPKNIFATRYVCPMKEHADVISDKPGNCPKCGMELVEKRVQMVEFVCPMKEHGDVISHKPGKCPKCGMNLVPKKP
jgi:predicted nucleic-acid-binding Zn-ribbon protein